MKRVIPFLIAIALVATACGGSDSDDVASIDGTTVTTSDDARDVAASTEEALLDFGACMRDNGVPDFPDPMLAADGSVDFGARSGEDPFADVDDDVAQAAVEACIGLLEGAVFGPGGVDFDLNEIQDRLVEFAACMRDQGIELDDPDLSDFSIGGGPEGLFGDLDLEDPEVIAAAEECQYVFADFGVGG